MQLSAAIEEFAVHLTDERGLSAHTVRSYRSDLVAFASFAAGQEVTGSEQLSLAVLRDWLYEDARRELAAATRARRVASLRAFCRWLARQTGIIDPSLRLKAPKNRPDAAQGHPARFPAADPRPADRRQDGRRPARDP